MSRLLPRALPIWLLLCSMQANAELKEAKPGAPVAPEESMFEHGNNAKPPSFDNEEAEAEEPNEFDQPDEPPMWSEDSLVIDLTDDDFDEKVKDGSAGPWFVEFYAPWCGHCKALAPEYEELAKTIQSRGDAVKIAKVDGTVHSKKSQEYEVQGYPNLKLIDDMHVWDYAGERTADAMAAWLAGEYKNEMGLKLPKYRTAVDDVKMYVKKSAEGIQQVHAYMPAFIPCAILIGFIGGILIGQCCGFLKKSRVAGLNHKFDVKITRTEAVDGQQSSAGLKINPMTMVVFDISKEHASKFKEMQRIQIGDTVIAVNKQPVVDAFDYQRIAHEVKEFTVTFARAGAPSNGKTDGKKED